MKRITLKDTQQLRLSIVAEDAWHKATEIPGKIVWKSSNTKVIKVKPEPDRLSATVVAIAAGVATVRAITSINPLRAKFRVVSEVNA